MSSMPLLHYFVLANRYVYLISSVYLSQPRNVHRILLEDLGELAFLYTFTFSGGLQVPSSLPFLRAAMNAA